jgi:ATP-dependent DNA helicase RecQ
MPFELRPFQRDALGALRAPGHVICVSPTGSGKSLIYERAAAEPGRRTLLVSPLVALARQQCDRLREAGVPTWLGAGGARERPDGPGTWIISPEMLRAGGNLRYLAAWKPDLLVSDECHCLWDWGADFRPDFAKVPELVHELGIPRSLWLTATLPPPARFELRSRLPAPVRELGEFRLPSGVELEVRRLDWSRRPEFLIDSADRWGARDPGIVFAATRESTERLARLLRSAGHRGLAYHAGLSSEEKRIIEALLRSYAPSPDQRPPIVVATSAFGMGMDIAGLRWVVLWQAPPSVLALAQAIGRVGRSAEARSQAVVLWDPVDLRLLPGVDPAANPRRAEAATRLLSYLREASLPGADAGRLLTAAFQS